MKRRLISLSSLTLTVVVNLTLASAHGRGGRGAEGAEAPETRADTGNAKEEDGMNVDWGRPGVGARKKLNTGEPTYP